MDSYRRTGTGTPRRASTGSADSTRTDNASQEIAPTPNNDTGADAGGDVATAKRGRGCLPWIILLLVLAGGGLATAGLMGTLILREETPLPGEAAITDIGLRMVAIPGEYADMRIPATADVNKGRQLFQAECALCHGQTGHGDATLGRTMYPPAADLWQSRTQTKTEGQLYYILAHGINLSGMPAWGEKFQGPNNDDELWSMVKYIRTMSAKQ